MSYKEVEQGYFDWLVEFMSDEECWFATLIFKNPNTPTWEMEKKAKEWLSRLCGALHIKLSEVEVRYVFDANWAGMHLLIKAPGVSGLDRHRWEDKWASMVEGSAKIKMIGYEDEIENEYYTAVPVANYIVAHHSHEVVTNMQFVA